MILYYERQNYLFTGLDRTLVVQEFDAFRISRQPAREDDKVAIPRRRPSLPPE